jgi:hypothetical protein
MNTTAIKTIGLALVLLASISSVHAQSPQSSTKVSTGGKTEEIAIESESGLQEFLDAYVAANNAKDFANLKAMRHPKDLAAWTAFLEHQPAAPGQTKPSLEQSLLRPAVPENHPPFHVERFLEGSPLPQARFMDWPVPPTHEAQLTYETGANSTHTLLLELVHADEQWFVVGGVPNAEFIQKMTKGKAP